MNKLIFITDYIEGLPVVASVRYSELIDFINNRFDVLVINNNVYGAYTTQYSCENLKYVVVKNGFSLEQSKRREGFIRNKLRNGIMLSIWRAFLYAKSIFRLRNIKFFENLGHLLNTRKYDAVLVTVPEVYGIYIVQFIKSILPNIPVVTEIRDIINHNIGKGNPKLIYRNVEKMIARYSDGIIALTKGINDHYLSVIPPKTIMKVVYNGYDEKKFSECIFHKISPTKDILKFAHIGSIYKGRSIGEFIQALQIIQADSKQIIEFEIVGVLDSQAYDEINTLLFDIDHEKIRVHITGALSHEEAIQKLKSIDIAVILTHPKGSDYAIPGKTFEYIGACKPIIAVTNDPPLVELVSGKYGECALHNASDIAVKIIKIINSDYCFDDRHQYSRKNQANQIIEFIDQVIINKN
jgi:glycosyltransferase involved in cell wall biosynthesis